MRTINKYVKPSYAVDVWVIILKALDSDFMGYDLPTGKGGNIPDSKTYKRMYLTEAGDTTIISNSIGQGEVP
jgi:penicillin-binding protein 2